MFKKKEHLHFATTQSIEVKWCKIKRDNKINLNNSLLRNKNIHGR